MTKSGKNTVKDKIEVFVPSPNKPRAIVLVFGWLGSNLRYVNKYSQLYHARNCTTITGIVDSYAVMTGDKPILDAFALEAARKAIKLLKEHSDLPVMSHVFSNGGTLPLNRLEVIIHKAHLARASGTMTSLDVDLISLGEAWQKGGQIFDSSPAYPDSFTAIRAIGSSVSNTVVRVFLQAMFLLMVVVDKPLVWLSGSPPKAEQLWTHVMDRPIAKRQAYIYSSHDAITNCDKLEELIAHRKQSVGSEYILVKKFTDSHHVMHYRKHPEEYSAFVDEMLIPMDSSRSLPTLVADQEVEERKHILVDEASPQRS